MARRVKDMSLQKTRINTYSGFSVTNVPSISFNEMLNRIRANSFVESEPVISDFDGGNGHFLINLPKNSNSEEFLAKICSDLKDSCGKPIDMSKVFVEERLLPEGWAEFVIDSGFCKHKKIMLKNKYQYRCDVGVELLYLFQIYPEAKEYYLTLFGFIPLQIYYSFDDSGTKKDAILQISIDKKTKEMLFAVVSRKSLDDFSVCIRDINLDY